MCDDLTAPVGWHDVIHRMGRHCRNWDYCGKGVYQIIITLADRKSRALGRLCHEAAKGAWVGLSEVGRLVEAVLAELPRQWPGVEILGYVIIPDHLHFVVAVRARQKKPLGAIVGSFKSKATSRWLDLLGRARPGATGGGGPRGVRTLPGGVSNCVSVRAPKLWSEGYVDNILFDAQAQANSLAYLADNPRRLWEKLAHPELFIVLRDLPVNLGGFTGHFAAIGNHNLLKAHSILQVQCSWRFFAYARDAPPRVCSSEFRESCEALLEEAIYGAVLISPCISEGEREIARRASSPVIA